MCATVTNHNRYAIFIVLMLALVHASFFYFIDALKYKL